MSKETIVKEAEQAYGLLLKAGFSVDGAQLMAQIMVAQAIDRLTATLAPIAKLAAEIAPLIEQAKAEAAADKATGRTK